MCLCKPCGNAQPILLTVSLYIMRIRSTYIWVISQRGYRLRIVFVSRADFETCLVDNPTLALKLIRSLTQRVRELTDIVKNLALHDVYGRVARTLLKLAHMQGGRLIVDQRLTHQEIANMVVL